MKKMNEMQLRWLVLLTTCVCYAIMNLTGNTHKRILMLDNQITFTLDLVSVKADALIPDRPSQKEDFSEIQPTEVPQKNGYNGGIDTLPALLVIALPLIIMRKRKNNF